MDFKFTDEQDSLREAARDAIGRNRTEPVPGDAVHNEKMWQALAELGALGLPFPEDAGGMGAGPIEAMIVAAELGRVGARTAYADTLMAVTLLGQDELAGAAMEGSRLVVPALYEPMRAWSPEPARVTTDGSALEGVREPVPFAAAAPSVVTTARGDDGIAVYAIESPTFDGARLDLAGQSARHVGGDAHLRQALNLGTLVLAGEALGAMESALGLTVEYLKSRKQFGVPLMKFQTLTQRAADMYTSLELARSAIYFGAMSLAEDPEDDLTISRMKVITGKAGKHIGQEAIQLHGGIGMTAEYAVGHYTARLTEIEHSLGDTRYHLGRLAARVKDYGALDLVG
ncbi:MAG: acyl-CoA dehydrogenase family protein [Actinobacteria bacterium]|nr:acyl-CoA dehydrogenase family protein [Actinomycetota bacterium]